MFLLVLYPRRLDSCAVEEEEAVELDILYAVVVVVLFVKSEQKFPTGGASQPTTEIIPQRDTKNPKNYSSTTTTTTTTKL